MNAKAVCIGLESCSSLSVLSVQGTDRDFERAAEAYMHAHSQSNS